MNLKRGAESKKNLKRHIAVILAFVMMAVTTVSVYSEPAENAPADPSIENPAPVQETEGQPVQEPVTDPNADPNANPNLDPNADPNANPNADPNADPNALHQNAEGAEDLSENALSQNDTDYYDPFDDFIYEDDEEEPYTGPFDETEATVSGSLSTGSLQRLINEAEPGEETLIELNKDVSISAQLIVEGGRKISIDLKGNSLVSTGKGRSIRREGFFGKYDISVSGDGSVLDIRDSGNRETGRGKYVVSDNNGIAVFKGGSLEITDAVLEQNGELYYAASAATGGKITVSRGSVSGNLDNSNGGIISLYGGKYTVEPKSEFLAKNHGYVIYKAAPLYKYEVREKKKVYIKPVIDDGFLINGCSLSESGVRKELFDEEGKRIGGTDISGGKFVETDENGDGPKALSSSMIYGEAGSVHYMTVLDDDFPNEIEISDAADNKVLLTDIFEIINRSEADSNSVVSFTAEEPGSGNLSIGLKDNKKLYCGRPLNDPFEIFDVIYTHGDITRKLDKNSNVRFTFDNVGETYLYENKVAGSSVQVSAAYRGSEAAAEFTVEKQPVVIVGNDESTLVGEELSQRYYQKISVYPVDPDGSVQTDEPVSVNSSMAEWTDVTSSLLDLTGVDKDKAGVYEKVELSDINRLNDEKSKNFELIGRGYLKYNVQPSIVLEFMTPVCDEPIADRRILEADSKSCIVGMFKNGKPSAGVKWMVKNADRKIVDSAEAGITVKPANNGNGAIFTFDESIAKAGGGVYTIYEVIPRVKISGKIDEDKKLSVAAITPVIFNGNKFVAENDERYYADGTAKKGYSPVLDVKVYDGAKELEIGKDYVLSYKYNKKAQQPGSKKSPVVVVTGKGDYAGAKIRAYFNIMPQ